jgi:hypothetical protein
MFTAKLIPPPVPKMTKDVFEPIGNFYIVRQGGKYHYFPVKVEKHPPNAPMPILKFEKLPPVLMEGWVVTQHRTYLVSIKDLHRGIVRTSNEYALAKKDDETGKSTTVRAVSTDIQPNTGRPGEGGTSENAQQQAATPVQVEPAPFVGDIRSILQPGVVEAFGVEFDEVVNGTFDQQVATLQHLDDTEE